MQHESIAVLAVERIDDLGVPIGAQRSHDDCLSLTARKRRRTVSSRQEPGANVDGANGLGVAPVNSGLTGKDSFPNKPAFQAAKLGANVSSAPVGLSTCQSLDDVRLNPADLRVTLLDPGVEQIGGLLSARLGLLRLPAP